MVETGHGESSRDASIMTLGYHSARGPIPVETFRRRELLARRSASEMGRPQQPDFHVVLVGLHGQVRHTVDFADVEIRRGRVLHVRPGQVQRWGAPGGGDCSIVVFPAAAALLDDWFPGGPPRVRDLTGIDLSAVLRTIEEVAEEQDRYDGSPDATAVLAGLLAVFMARLGRGRPPAQQWAERPEPYVAFRRHLESDLAWSHHVADHAARLGYSPRTLSRTCLAVRGRTAKQVLDERLVLEAQRLLVHTNRSIANIARSLGWSEPTNLTKAFRRVVSISPQEFRSRAGLDRAGRHSI